MLHIANYTTKRVLIDNRSFADILFWDANTKMNIGLDRLRPAPTPLKGFLGDVLQLVGTATLPVMVRKGPITIATMANFLVVKAHLSYNIIIRSSTLNRFRAKTSTFHLKMKFATKAGVGKVRAKQVLVRECLRNEINEQIYKCWN